jgi:hypothetical protein
MERAPGVPGRRRRALLDAHRSAQAAQVAELERERQRLARWLVSVSAPTGADAGPPVADPTRQQALDAAWRTCQEAYRRWCEAYEAWRALRSGVDNSPP